MQLALIVFTASFILNGCTEDVYMPADDVRATNSIGTPIPQPEDPRVTMSLADIIHNLLPDMGQIPDTANTYGLGTLFIEYDGTFASKVYLGEWGEIDTVEISRQICIGYTYSVSVWVYGLTLTDGIAIRDTLLWHTIKDGEAPWYRLFATFSLERDPVTDNVYLYRGDNTNNRLVPIRVVFDGHSEFCPPYVYNGPPASASYPAYAESNLTWGQPAPMFWQASEQLYARWLMAYPGEPTDTTSYNLSVTVPSEPVNPPIMSIQRRWGVNIGVQEIWHIWQLIPPPNSWYLFLFGVNQDGTINQGQDNRTYWSG